MPKYYDQDCSISNKEPSISIEIPSISVKNLGFRPESETLGFSKLELEILGFSSRIPGILKTWNFDYKAGTKLTIMFNGH